MTNLNSIKAFVQYRYATKHRSALVRIYLGKVFKHPKRDNTGYIVLSFKDIDTALKEVCPFKLTVVGDLEVFDTCLDLSPYEALEEIHNRLTQSGIKSRVVLSPDYK